MRAVIREFAGKVPVLGVCLGHQCIYDVYGGTVAGAGERSSTARPRDISHDGKGCSRTSGQVQGCPIPLACGQSETAPTALEVTATPRAASLWACATRELTVEGVQFHPESIATEHGKELLKNFLDLEGGRW